VILTKDEQVYHRISTEMPDVDGRQKLLPFAGKLVKVSGRISGGNAVCAIRLEEAP
jgi:hypothetical protein